MIYRVVIKGDVVVKDDPELSIISPRLKRMIASNAAAATSSSSTAIAVE